MLELATLVSHHAKYRPHATAVVVEDERLTWAQFGERVARCANMLRALGVGKGDKVATVLGNRRELLEVYWAAPTIGAVLVPLSPLLTPAGLTSLLKDSEPKCLVTERATLATVGAMQSARALLPPERVLVVDGAQGGYADYQTLTQPQATSSCRKRWRARICSTSCTRAGRRASRKASCTRISSARCMRR
jgi:acyl-CoA synthetase (AMP-forming)/AMP-acid ligase II